MVDEGSSRHRIKRGKTADLFVCHGKNNPLVVGGIISDLFTHYRLSQDQAFFISLRMRLVWKEQARAQYRNAECQGLSVHSQAAGKGLFQQCFPENRCVIVSIKGF